MDSGNDASSYNSAIQSISKQMRRPFRIAIYISVLVVVVMVIITITAFRLVNTSPGNSQQEEDLTSIHFNSGGWVYPKDKQTINIEDVYFSIIALSKKYNLVPKGSGTKQDDYRSWQMGVFCQKNLTAHFSVSEDTGNLNFGLFAYGFKYRKDYDGFKADILELLGKYGTFNQVFENPILSPEALKKKAVTAWKTEDITSQCAVN